VSLPVGEHAESNQIPEKQKRLVRTVLADTQKTRQYRAGRTQKYRAEFNVEPARQNRKSSKGAKNGENDTQRRAQANKKRARHQTKDYRDSATSNIPRGHSPYGTLRILWLSCTQLETIRGAEP